MFLVFFDDKLWREISDAKNIGQYRRSDGKGMELF